MYPLKRLTKTLTLLGTLALCSCGGESSDAELSESALTQVSKTEFDQALGAEGTWLATFDLLTSFRTEFESESIQHEGGVNVDLTAFAIAPFYLSTEQGNDLARGQCSVYGALETPNSDYNNGFNEEFLLEELEDKLGLHLDTTFCAGDMPIAELYFKNAADDYATEYYCGEEKVGGLRLERIADEPGFFKGSLSFTSDTYPDLEPSQTPDGCGSLLEFDVVARANPKTGESEDFLTYGFDMSALSITSDYQGGTIGMSLLFSNTLTLGEHEVSSPAEIMLADNASKVAVTLTSAEFGGTASFPMNMVASRSSVTVTQITDKSASGTYDFTTDNGANFSGKFSFDYE